MQTFDSLEFIEKLTKLGQRQGGTEIKAAEMIIKTLEVNGINFFCEYFNTKIPLIKKARLVSDGKELYCRGSSFMSGKIEDKQSIISSLIPSRYNLFYPNINFNPESRTISLSNFYFAPSVAIARGDLSKIINAKKVSASVEVEKVNHRSMNILAGTREKPKRIFFAHYDSIGPGATDNAAGIASLIDLLISAQKVMENNLMVFSGNEELSYDKPIYWGHCYRIFEKEHGDLLDNAEEIFVVDCIGNGKTNIYKDDESKHLAFPIINSEYLDKSKIISGDPHKLMEVYHSDDDTVDKIKENFLKDARDLLQSKILRI